MLIAFVNTTFISPREMPNITMASPTAARQGPIHLAFVRFFIYFILSALPAVHLRVLSILQDHGFPLRPLRECFRFYLRKSCVGMR